MIRRLFSLSSSGRRTELKYAARIRWLRKEIHEADITIASIDMKSLGPVKQGGHVHNCTTNFFPSPKLGSCFTTGHTQKHSLITFSFMPCMRPWEGFLEQETKSSLAACDINRPGLASVLYGFAGSKPPLTTEKTMSTP
jgi:hypothetical protein